MNKKNILSLNHQNSIVNTVNNHSHSGLGTTSLNFFSSYLSNINDNVVLTSLNCNENLKTEFSKKENELKERAKSSYEMNDGLLFGDIKKIANETIIFGPKSFLKNIKNQVNTAKT